MSKQKLYQRTRILIGLVIFVIVIFLYFLLGKSAAFTGLNVRSDEIRENAMEKQYRAETIEGTILDSKGMVLSQGSEPGEGALLTFPDAYSWLLGYNSSLLGSFGLRGRYENYLYMQGKNKQGAEITLTLDHGVQMMAHDLIKGSDGSMIVLEAKTGRILALASSRSDASFNSNELDQKMDEYNTCDGFFLPYGYKDAKEPGSVFKVVTASAILEHDMQDETVHDEGSLVVGSHTVVNVGRKARGDISLAEGLGYSSNVYFATKGLELGGVVLKDKAEDFLIGQNIDLDFTSLKSHFNLDNFNDELLADTSYGQGQTLVTPLHIAMIYQAIANKGDMAKPYMIEEIKLGKKKLYKGKKETIANPISKETAQKLDGILENVASKYYKIEMDGIRAKTGTAQITGGLKLYFASYNDKYVVVRSMIAQDGYGQDLKKSVIEMYRYLETLE